MWQKEPSKFLLSTLSPQIKSTIIIFMYSVTANIQPTERAEDIFYLILNK